MKKQLLLKTECLHFQNGSVLIFNIICVISDTPIWFVKFVMKVIYFGIPGPSSNRKKLKVSNFTKNLSLFVTKFT